MPRYSRNTAADNDIGNNGHWRVPESKLGTNRLYLYDAVHQDETNKL